MKAIRVHAFGGPDVLQYEDIPEPTPKQGEALVKIDAAGVNFIDVYQRTGLYKLSLPVTVGQEGAGTVVALGSPSDDVKVGDRVAWTSILGSYAQMIVVPMNSALARPMALKKMIRIAR